MNIIGLHGVRSNGRRSTDKLLKEIHHQDPTLEIVTTLDYKLSIIDTYCTDKVADVVGIVYDAYQDGDVIVTHSAGALIMRELLTQLYITNRPPPPVIFMFNAALDVNTPFDSDTYGMIVNVVDTKDYALFFAQFLPFNPMGQMGRIGHPTANDVNRIKNIVDKDQSNKSKLGHGDYFEDDQIERVADRVIRVIKKYT